MASRTLEVQIIGDAASLERALGRSAKSAESFGKRVSRSATIAGAALAGGLALGAKIGFDELREGQDVSAQTAAALKSTGDAANVTQEHIEDLATSLSRMSGVDDEVIQGSENVLLAFTNVRNEVGKGNDIFDRATKVVLDYAARTGRDAAGAARQFGKALQDPVKYASALARAGVVLTDQQKKQIKAFSDAGKPMEAQKVLLGALEERYGGAAKAAGETMTGQLNKAQNAFREMAASVVTALLPAMEALTAVITRVANYLQDHQQLAKALGAAFVALAAVLLTVGAATKIWAATQAVITAATAAWTAAQWLLNAALTANPIGVVVVALAALVAGLVLAWKNSETFRNIVTGAFNAVKTAANFVLDFFRNNWKVIAAVFLAPFIPIAAAAVGLFLIKDHIVNAANFVLDFFRNNWKTIAVLISGPFAPLVALATNAFGIRSAMVDAFNTIKDRVSDVINDIVGKFRWLAQNAGKIWQNVYDAMKPPIDAVIGLLQQLLDILNAVRNAVGAVLDKVEGAIGKVGGFLGKAGSLIPGRAAGGPVKAGQPYIVGESGRELFIPASNGSVIPSTDARGFSGTASSGGVTNITVNVPNYLGSPREVAQVIREELIQMGKRNGGNVLGGYA